LNATIARVYDGSVNAAGSDLSSFNALQGGETLTMTGTGTVSSKNVANGQSVTVGSLALADGTGLASNYSLNSAALNITQRPINTAYLSRTYNASTVVAGSSLSSMTNLVGSETLTLSGNGALTNANVGNNKAVSSGTLALANGSNGGVASNYTFSGGTHLLTVTPAPISFTGTRQYNATTDVEAANITLTGLQGGEDLTVTGDGSISSGNVGAGKAANSSGLTLGNGVSGTAGTASNYTFTGGTHTFNVTQRVLNSSGSKTYDGNTNAVASDVTLSNLAGGETLSHSGTATLGSKNVGSSTISNLSGISIADGTGTASNYTLTGGTHSFTVNRRVVNVSGTRLYNALSTAVASDLSTMTNLVGSETLVLSNSGSLANANVG